MKLFPCALAWRCLAPARVEAFCLLAITGKISAANKLRRGSVSEPISDMLFAEGGGVSRSFIPSMYGIFSKLVVLHGVFQVQ